MNFFYDVWKKHLLKENVESTQTALETAKAKLKAAQEQQSNQAQAKAQEQAMKAATVDVGGSGEVSRKVYRRQDLIKLRMTEPERYMAMSDEIMAAYAEGRVK